MLLTINPAPIEQHERHRDLRSPRGRSARGVRAGLRRRARLRSAPRRIHVHASPGGRQAEEHAGENRDQGGIAEDHAVDADVLRRGQDGLAERIEHARPTAHARTRASALPQRASSTLSVRSWPSTRRRLAPIAMRTAISRRRAAARAIRRFARSAQAIRSTNRTAPKRTRSARRTSTTSAPCSDFTSICVPRFSGCSAMIRSAMRFRSAARAGRARVRAEPADHAQEVVVVRVHVVAGGERHRHHGLRVDAEEREPGRKDPDDRVRLGAEHDRLSDDGGVGGEPAPPEAVGQDGHAVITPSLVGEQEVAADRGRRAQRAEELRRNDQGADALRLVASRDVERPGIEGREGLEGAAARPGTRSSRAARCRRAAALVDGLHELEARRVRVGERAQQHRVHHAEHDGIGPDAEGEHDHGDRGQSRAAPHHPEREPAVLDDHLQKRQAAAIAVELLRLLEPSQLEQARRGGPPPGSSPPGCCLRRASRRGWPAPRPARAPCASRSKSPRTRDPQRPQPPHDAARAAKKRASTVAVCCHSRVSFSTCFRPARVRR